MVATDVYAFMRADRAYFEDFISRSTYHSNAIEGNTLSLAETYALQFSDNSLKVTATPREIYEAINYKYALTAAMASGGELADTDVIAIAKAINRNIGEIGGYRRVQVVIRGAEHMPPAPGQVNQMMHTLLHDYALDLEEEVDPFIREAGFHIRFERIHPFEDGNGRTGRILMSRGLLASGLPPAVIRADSRAEYLSLIAERDIDGLARMMSRLSSEEAERIESFSAVARDDLVPHLGHPHAERNLVDSSRDGR